MEPAVTATIGPGRSRKAASSGVGTQSAGVSQKQKPVTRTKGGQSGAGGWKAGEQARQVRRGEALPSQKTSRRGGRPKLARTRLTGASAMRRRIRLPMD